ncbi:MAG TPA: hypothetical protein VK638_14410 [Edaphobacter sp.]|nr:hypothetical protein [Edaphobacter sp.]
MFEHNLPAIVRVQDLADYLRILINDRCMRDDVKDAIQLAPESMLEGKAKVCESLASAGENRQSKNAAYVFGRFEAAVRNLSEQRINRVHRPQVREEVFKPIRQRCPAGVVAGLAKGSSAMAFEVGGFGAIRGNQATEEKTNQEAALNQHSNPITFVRRGDAHCPAFQFFNHAVLP